MAENPKKSKLPDLNEIGGIASKLFNDFKNSVTEIVSDYQEKRAEPSKEKEAPQATAKPAATSTTSAEKPSTEQASKESEKKSAEKKPKSE